MVKEIKKSKQMLQQNVLSGNTCAGIANDDGAFQMALYFFNNTYTPPDSFTVP